MGRFLFYVLTVFFFRFFLFRLRKYVLFAEAGQDRNFKSERKRETRSCEFVKDNLTFKHAVIILIRDGGEVKFAQDKNVAVLSGFK